MRLPALALACAALMAAAAQAQTPAPTWTVETPKDGEARLYLGQGGLSLRCVRGTGQITADIPVAKRLADHREGEVWVDGSGLPAPWPASVTLVSGTDSARLRGQANPDEASGGSALRTEISTAAPVIKAWRGTAVLQVNALGETLTPPSAPKGMVRKFLGACK